MSDRPSVAGPGASSPLAAFPIELEDDDDPPTVWAVWMALLVARRFNQRAICPGQPGGVRP